ncbi:MAG: ECF-type sigma factor [Planctomycetota bacterium]
MRDDATAKLRALAAGEESAALALSALCYAELREIAGRLINREAPGRILSPTDLVHETFLRLIHFHGITIAERTHFLRIAAKAMRQILVDQARERATLKRGGDLKRVSLDTQIEVDGARQSLVVDFLDLESALVELEKRSSRQALIVELRFLAGMSEREIAAGLELSLSTVEMEWRLARAWLYKKLVR